MANKCKSRLYESIINGVDRRISKKEWTKKEKWTSKTAFRELMEHPNWVEDIGKLLKVIKEETEEFVCNFIEKDNKQQRYSTARGMLRKVIEKRIKPEDKLERVLTASVDGLHNRFNFLSGLTLSNNDKMVRHMTVDLVMIDKRKKIRKIIELKEWNNISDHPVNAMFECIMYFILYVKTKVYSRELPDLHSPVVLTVLAPCAYYDYWIGKNDYYEILRLFEQRMISSLGKITGEKVQLSFDQIDLSEDVIEKVHCWVESIEKIFKESGKTRCK